ncbi:MAG: ZIP family metal transporter [Erysipelotrichaceae bacterium]|nr:ZIP family metal transporter [Erysipelotrichaceae bacterium]
MHFILQAFLATLFTYLMTTLGSMIVLFFKKINNKLLSFIFGFSSGIMIASSFFSLLLSSLEEINIENKKQVLLVILFFFIGSIFILILDKIFDKKDSNINIMTLSITLHNIPEGMAIGVAFGLCYLNNIPYTSAWILALGIGIQNLPEGSAVSLPLYSQGYSKGKSFFLGQLSGLVEVIFGLLGALFVLFFNTSLPYVLSFAAGTMIYVVCSELIPETFKENKNLIGILGILLGFTLMMSLDLLL